jgi:F0F1-type ATP synthase assembly protein I
MTRSWKELGRYGGVGIELVLGILILSAIGHWFDTRYGGGRDWGMAIGFFLGIAVGVRNLMRVASNMQKDIERAEAQDPEASRWTVDESWLHKPDEKDSDDPRR